MGLRYKTPLLVTCFSALACAIVFTQTGCNTSSSDVLAVAYVAPSSLNVRSDLRRANSKAAVLKHGEEVSIIDVRRRFVKIRTSKGIEGWVDSIELLSQEQMDQMRRETQHALLLPSQGKATVFEALNVHIEPSRQSPPFMKIPEGGSVEVLAHRIEPRTRGPIKPPVFFVQKHTPSRHTHGRQSKNNFHLPPKPPPPPPPANWRELSLPIANSQANGASKEKMNAKKEESAKPVVMEDWTLVRTRDKRCGWVLSRNLMMSIPDEVAQYAEGKRITSYFDLGTVDDVEKGVKHNWLWTTSSTVLPYDFDGWRVFLWNRRRHRFETSYRQRDVEGYFPVHVDPPDSNAAGRTFEIITKSDNGQFWRRTYLFDGVRVHLAGEEKYRPDQINVGTKINRATPVSVQQKTHRPSWLHRKWIALRKKLGGK